MIRTVLGDLPPAAFGVCDAHDHLFFRSALLPGQELDDEDAALAEVRAFTAAGGQAIVQWTPYGLGRRAELLPGISTSTGVSLVAATGLHRREHYPDGFVDKVRDQLVASDRRMAQAAAPRPSRRSPRWRSPPCSEVRCPEERCSDVRRLT